MWLFTIGDLATVPFLDAAPRSWKYLFPVDEIPVKGPLSPDTRKAAPAIFGQTFPEGGWDPLLRAGAIAGLFAPKIDYDWIRRHADIVFVNPDQSNSPPKVREEVLEADLRVLSSYLSVPLPDWQYEDIIGQAQTFSDYFTRLLACSSEFRPNTFTMIMLGIQIGGLVAATFKVKYMRARPGQVWSALAPLIPTPRHPSFPSGHALQSALVARFISEAVPAWEEPLQSLAQEIGFNRQLARVHYPSDTAASMSLVEPIFEAIKDIPEFNKIFEGVQNEYGVDAAGNGLWPQRIEQKKQDSGTPNPASK